MLNLNYANRWQEHDPVAPITLNHNWKSDEKFVKHIETILDLEFFKFLIEIAINLINLSFETFFLYFLCL